MLRFGESCEYEARKVGNSENSRIERLRGSKRRAGAASVKRKGKDRPRRWALVGSCGGAPGQGGSVSNGDKYKQPGSR